jgi:hypothetical protein
MLTLPVSKESQKFHSEWMSSALDTSTCNQDARSEDRLMEAKQIFRAAALACVFGLGTGCMSSGQTKPASDQLVENQQVTIPILAGKSVELQIDMFQRVRKKGGIYSHGQEYDPEDIEIRPIKRTANEEMQSNWLVEDVRLSLNTNDQLDYFEQSLENTIEHSGATLSSSGDADYTLEAKLTFGPTPAPAYQSYNLGKSMGVGLLTLGLGPKSYSAETDYEVRFVLKDSKGRILTDYSQTIREEKEVMKHNLNISRHNQVRDIAVEIFRLSLTENLASFSSEASSICIDACRSESDADLSFKSPVN